MISSHIKKHAKIDTILWHPQLQGRQGLEEEVQQKSSGGLGQEQAKVKVVPATVWKDTERTETPPKFLNTLSYDYKPGEPVPKEAEEAKLQLLH